MRCCQGAPAGRDLVQLTDHELRDQAVVRPWGVNQRQPTLTTAASVRAGQPQKPAKAPWYEPAADEPTMFDTIAEYSRASPLAVIAGPVN